MKRFINVLGLVVVLMVLVACGSSEQGDADEVLSVLTMGTSADFYPFQFIDLETEEIVGFDVDVARHIATELGYELLVEDMNFDSLIPALRTGRFDMVLASMNATEQRRELVDFSDVYHQSSPAMVLTTRDVSLESVEDLTGLIIGVQTGSTQSDIAEGLIYDGIAFETLIMDRIPDLVQQLITGRVDAIILDDAPAAGHVRNNENLVLADIIEDAEPGIAIALPQGSELTAQINEILADMLENGKMDELVEQWLTGDE